MTTKLPPKLLIRLGLAKKGEMWLVEKALYMDSGNGGTVETSKSARCLSRWAMRSVSTSRAFQRRTDLWLVRRKDAVEEAHVEGLVLVYVDDVMLFGTKEVVEQGLQHLGRRRRAEQSMVTTARTSAPTCGKWCGGMAWRIYAVLNS